MDADPHFHRRTGIRSSPQGQAALVFANSLAAGEFDEAHAMLSRSLRARLTPDRLRVEYEQMIDYRSEPADFVDVMNVLDDWPDKQAGDVGWAYVAISGKGFSEAVAVVVVEEEGKIVMRQIDWGRP